MWLLTGGVSKELISLNQQLAFPGSLLALDLPHAIGLLSQPLWWHTLKFWPTSGLEEEQWASAVCPSPEPLAGSLNGGKRITDLDRRVACSWELSCISSLCFCACDWAALLNVGLPLPRTLLWPRKPPRVCVSGEGPGPSRWIHSVADIRLWIHTCGKTLRVLHGAEREVTVSLLFADPSSSFCAVCSCWCLLWGYRSAASVPKCTCKYIMQLKWNLVGWIVEGCVWGLYFYKLASGSKELALPHLSKKSSPFESTKCFSIYLVIQKNTKEIVCFSPQQGHFHHLAISLVDFNCALYANRCLACILFICCELYFTSRRSSWLDIPKMMLR